MSELFSEYNPYKDMPKTEEEEIEYDARNTETLLEAGFITTTVYDEIQTQLQKRRDELCRRRVNGNPEP